MNRTFCPARTASGRDGRRTRPWMPCGGRRWGWVVAGSWKWTSRKFFDTLDHAQLRELLRQRIRDGVLLRLIGKWLNAGVLEDGNVTFPSAGTPQGGVILPLRANVYLHYVLDVWFEQEVKPRLQGRAFLIRYADDFVIGFACEEDARRVLDVLPKRFGKYGLTLHPDKTRLVAFRPPSGPRQWFWCGPPARNVRPAGVHPLLGPLAEGELGGQALHGCWPTPAGDLDDRSVVPVAPPSSDPGPASDAESEAAWSLCVLRNHGQRRSVAPLPGRGAARLAEVAVAPLVGRRPLLGRLQRLAAALPAAAGRGGPLGVPRAANPCRDEPYALIGHVRICGSPG